MAAKWENSEKKKKSSLSSNSDSSSMSPHIKKLRTPMVERECLNRLAMEPAIEIHYDLFSKHLSNQKFERNKACQKNFAK